MRLYRAVARFVAPLFVAPLRVLTGLALGFWIAGAVGAAQPVSVLKDHDTKEPIDISADRLEVRQGENLALFVGNVEALQGDLQLTADRLVVYYETAAGATDPTIRRLDVEGSVRLQSPSEDVSAQWGVYDVDSRLVTLGGEVVLTRGDTVVEGDRLELDLDSGLTRVDAATTGAGQKPGRVRGRFALPDSESRDRGEDEADKPLRP